MFEEEGIMLSEGEAFFSACPPPATAHLTTEKIRETGRRPSRGQVTESAGTRPAWFERSASCLCRQAGQAENRQRFLMEVVPKSSSSIA